nr:hypothetical protein [Mucilaginibacter sp. X4EP1]MCS3814669.1 hypothetical protein [Mucilaginibacter sp. X4EP1]
MAESAELKHAKLVDFLKTLPFPWGLPKDFDISFPGFGEEFTATSNLNKFIGNGIKMSVFYRYRNMLEDDQSCDDRIYIEFNSKKIDYSNLVTIIFPQFVKNFGAYTSDIYDRLLIFKNHEEKRFENRRRVINRVYPISFYDEILCQTFFKLSPKKITDLLKGHVYKAEVFNDGIIIIADTKPFSIDESIDFENKMKLILKY